MKTKHTPTPWKIKFGCKTFSFLDGSKMRSTVMISAYPNGIVLCSGTIKEADAEFIIRAVNSFEKNEAELKSLKQSHEALLKVAKDYITLVQSEYEGLNGLIPPYDKIIPQTKKLIAQAERKV